MKKGMVNGMIRVYGKWDNITLDMDNANVHYLGRVLTEFNNDSIHNLIHEQTSMGKMVLSDGMKPLQYMNRFKL